MITFELTPTHFAEFAWSKMRLTRFDKPRVAVPDMVRLLNLERAMLDAQRHEAHRLADFVMTRDPALAAEMRADADARHDKRWKQIGGLISAMGRASEPVQIDWTLLDLALHSDLDDAYHADAFARAQAQAVYCNEDSHVRAKIHRLLASERKPEAEAILRLQLESGLSRGLETAPEET